MLVPLSNLWTSPPIHHGGCNGFMHVIMTNIVQIGHKKRLFMVGRLDKESTGLLLLTNDGRLVNALLRSTFAHKKHYVVQVDRELRREDMQQLSQGVVITTEAQRERGRKALTAATRPCPVKQVRVLCLVMFVSFMAP
jgi:pseudouridine synthase